MAKWLLEGVMMDVMCGNFLMVKVIKETKGEMFFYSMAKTCYLDVFHFSRFHHSRIL